MSDLVGRFARDTEGSSDRLLITRHFPDPDVVHYTYVDAPGGGSQQASRLEIEPHPADEANRLRQEIEELRDEHWEKSKECSEIATRCGQIVSTSSGKKWSQSAERHREFAVRLTQILEGVNG